MNPWPWIESLGRASVEGGLLILGVWATCRLWSGMSAWAKSGLWWLASARLLIALLPLAAIPIHAPMPVSAVWWPAALAAAPPAPASAASIAGPARALGPSGNPAASQASRVPWSSTSPAARRPLDPRWLPGLLCLVWAVGVGLRAGGMARQLGAVRRALRAARPVDETILAALGAPATVRLAASREAPVPMVTGPWAPVVLLPSAMLDRPRGDLRLAVAHELAHVRRGDLWLAWIPALAEALFWFHPLVARCTREYVQACEEACDEEALRATGASPYDYGRLLLALGVDRRWGGATAMPCGSPNPRQLTRRLSMLKHFVPLKPHVRAAAVGLVCAFGLVGLVPLRVVPTSAAPGAAAPSVAALAAPAIAESETPAVSVTVATEYAGPTSAAETETPASGGSASEKWKSDPPPDPSDDEVTPPPDEDSNPPDDPDANLEDEAPPAPPAVPAAPEAPRAPRASRLPTPAMAPMPRMTPMPGTPLFRKMRGGTSYGYSYSGDAAERFAYVIVHRDGQSMSGSGEAGDWNEARRLKQRLDHDFIWVRRGDRRYLIDDPDLVARAEETFEPARNLGERQGKLAAVQSRIGGEQSRIGQEQARIGARQSEIGRRQAQVAEEMARRQVGRARARELERLSDQLSEAMDDLGRQQDELGSQMEPLAQQQEELGRQMEQLSREMERLSRRSQRDIQSLIDEAIQNGDAKPLR